MPSKRSAIEWLRHEVEQGRGDEPVHLVDVRKEQAARIANDGPQPKTRVQFETDDPEMYSAFAAEKDRIIKRAKNKSVGISLMLIAWKRLSDSDIDMILAEEEGLAQKSLTQVPRAEIPEDLL